MRARTVAAALLVVGAALAGGSYLLVTQLWSSQLRGIDHALALEVGAVAALARAGTPLNPLPTASGESALVQVVTPGRQVIAASPDIQGQDPLGAVVPGSQIVYQTLPDLPIGEGGDYRLAAVGVAGARGQFTVYAAAPLSGPEGSLRTLVVALLIGDPLLLVLVGGVTWWLVRRALSPVERIRTEVAEISGRDLRRRVPVPPARDEIARLAATMNEMLDRLESSARRQDNFVADASHELKSPLTAARAGLEVALTHDPGNKSPEAARSALGEMERIQRIVDDLLVLARARGVDPVRSEVDLDEIALDEVARLRRTSPVVLDASKVSGARVLGNRELLSRAVRNLLDNAVRHARQTVTVGLETNKGQAELSVADDGRGVAEEDRTRIFERFARAGTNDAGAAASDGAGLGLAIVREIVANHGGTIELLDAHPGALFVMTLPTAQGAGDQ